MKSASRWFHYIEIHIGCGKVMLKTGFTKLRTFFSQNLPQFFGLKQIRVLHREYEIYRRNS
jgi:hypothetical protein